MLTEYGARLPFAPIRFIDQSNLPHRMMQKPVASPRARSRSLAWQGGCAECDPCLPTAAEGRAVLRQGRAKDCSTLSSNPMMEGPWRRFRREARACERHWHRSGGWPESAWPWRPIREAAV